MRISPCFRATFRGRSVFAYRNLPRSGVKYSLFFESLEAARWRGIDDLAWDSLGADDKARLIAHYRVHMQIEAVLAQEQARKHKRALRKGA
jgi:hypothetical protein